MSQLNIRTLLSKSVEAIKSKLGIESFTWSEYEDKLNEAMQDKSSVFVGYVWSEDGKTIQLPEEALQYKYCYLLVEINPGTSVDCSNKAVYMRCHMNSSKKYVILAIATSDGTLNYTGMYYISDTGVIDISNSSYSFVIGWNDGDAGVAYTLIAYNV